LEKKNSTTGRGQPQLTRTADNLPDSVGRYHGNTVVLPVILWYRNTTNTAVLSYGTCQQIVISAKIFVR